MLRRFRGVEEGLGGLRGVQGGRRGLGISGFQGCFQVIGGLRGVPGVEGKTEG
jgi:hypothetical protein